MGKKRKISVVSTGRRFSQDQDAPTTANAVAVTIQPERRRNVPPLIHFSQVVHETQEEDEDDLPYVLSPKKEKVPPFTEEPELLEPPPEPKREVPEDLKASPPNRGAGRRWAYKNVLGIGFSFFFIFSSFQSLQNLQSTINSSGGLGLVSLSLVYASFTLAGFISPSIIKILGTKYSLLISFFCHLCYTLANFYPSWYTLVPVSVLLGAASAPVWAAGSSHLVQIAMMVAPRLGVDQDHLISIYMGVFFSFFQAAQIPGNLASSLIFFPYKSDVNSTLENDSYLALDQDSLTDSGTCMHTGAGNDFDSWLLYVLVSVYTLLVISGILCLVTMVNHLGTEDKFAGCKNKLQVFLKAPLGELLGVMKNYRMILIAPISIFNGLEQSFAYGTFSEAFIARCFGTYQVGFTLIAMGLSSGISSVLYGKLAKCVPRLFIFLFGVLINVVLLVFLLVWTPGPSYIFIILFAVLWGAGDGVWNTMTASLTGILFPDCSGSAYSAQRIYLALGATMGFLVAELLAVQYRVWYMLGAVLLAFIAILIVEIKTQRKFRFSCQAKSRPDSASSSDVNDTGDANNDTKIANDFCSNGDSGIGEGSCNDSGVHVKIEVVENTIL